ncbi:MAG: DUF4097 family beta strand repeat-containing protein [Clostridium sp.]|nr:DUF4097 family beta strand repeat-containing protein [Clostridium sp.]
MNRDKYLTELGSYLAVLPMDRKTKILEFYNDHTAKLVANGEDLIEKLGTPKDLASNIIDTELGEKSSPAPQKGKKKHPLRRIIFTIIILFIVVFVGFFALLGLSGHVLYWDDNANRLAIGDSGQVTTLAKTKIEEIDNIDIDAQYATVYLIPSDDYYIEYSITSSKRTLYKIHNKKLIFDDSAWTFVRLSFGINDKPDDYINIYYPAGADINSLTTKLDMGGIEVSDAAINNMDIDLDMGSLSITDCTINKIDADLDMGSMDITGCVIGQIDADLDMGGIDILNTDISSADVSLDMGGLDMSDTHIEDRLTADLDMGNATISLTGNARCGFDLDCDMGSVTINGANMGRAYNDSGNTMIEIDCDMGSITIQH